MAQVIIFGCGKLAKLAHYYLTNDSDHEVIAFCVHETYLPEGNHFLSLPVVPFEVVEEMFPEDRFVFFAPLTANKMNTIKEEIYNSIKSKGYKLISYVSSKAIVYNCEIGDNCFIQAGNILHPFTKVGNNVTLWSNNLVAYQGEVEDHVTFASHVAVAENCRIGRNSYLGTNSTIRDKIIIANGTLVGIASVIVKNTEEWSVYMGNPAKKIGKNISKSILKM